MQVVLLSQYGKETYEFCARLYSELRREDAGQVHPYHRGYAEGGVHFNRDAIWFAEQLARPGARLAMAYSQGKQVGYALFFTDSANFPSFAEGCLQFRDIPGNSLGLAYTYLIAVERIERRLGFGWQLMQMAREVAREDGCGLIAHEFFVRPRVNIVSCCFHLKMELHWGAADTGRTASHYSEELGIEISYAQYLIPTKDGERVNVSRKGDITLS